MNIGTRGKMPPLIVHCMPGWPSKNPGLRPTSSVNARSKWLEASNGVGAGRP